jgi:hypothetical protein
VYVSVGGSVIKEPRACKRLFGCQLTFKFEILRQGDMLDVQSVSTERERGQSLWLALLPCFVNTVLFTDRYQFI